MASSVLWDITKEYRENEDTDDLKVAEIACIDLLKINNRIISITEEIRRSKAAYGSEIELLQGASNYLENARKTIVSRVDAFRAQAEYLIEIGLPRREARSLVLSGVVYVDLDKIMNALKGEEGENSED